MDADTPVSITQRFYRKRIIKILGVNRVNGKEYLVTDVEALFEIFIGNTLFLWLLPP